MLTDPFVASVPARYRRELLAAIKAALATIDLDIAGGGTVAPFMLDETAPADGIVSVIITDSTLAIRELKRIA